MFVPRVSPPYPYWFQPALRVRAEVEPQEVSPVEDAEPELGGFAKQLNDLAKSLRSLKNSSVSRRAPIVREQASAGALVLMSANLGFGEENRFATLVSSAESNSLPTSIGPVPTHFTGLTTTSPSIGGVYDGSSGNDTLTFVAHSLGVVGATALNFSMLNSAGETLQDFTVAAGYTPGSAIALNNGLTFALSQGLVVADSEFNLDVSATVGRVVDPTRSFGSSGNNASNFEPGHGVREGSFAIDGALINASQAGVQANYDPQTGKFELSSEAAFTMSQGSTNFLAEVGMRDGEYGGAGRLDRSPRLVFKRTRGLQQGLHEVGNAVRALIHDAVFSDDSAESKLVSGALTDAIRSAFGDLKPGVAGDILETGFGIDFDLSGDGTVAVKINQGQLSKALNSNAAELSEFLLGGQGAGGGKGFIAHLSKAIENIEGSVFPLLDPGGSGGVFVNKVG